MTRYEVVKKALLDSWEDGRVFRGSSSQSPKEQWAEFHAQVVVDALLTYDVNTVRSEQGKNERGFDI